MNNKYTLEQDSICGICPAGCWVRSKLLDGKLVDVAARPDHPLGIICELGKHSPEIVYSNHRIKTPLRRLGPKGSFDFEPLSWDSAFGIIVDKLNKTKEMFGAEAAAIYTGRGSFDLALCDTFQPKETAVSSASSVLFPFGSPNTFGVGALCYVAYAMIAPHVTMGGMLINMDSDLDQSELIVVWGTNPATDCPPLTHDQILKARRRGARIIVIDPRRTKTAKESGAQWIRIRPGTDGALALGLIQVLIEEELYDEKFVKNWTVGFDELKQYVQHFTPHIVEEITQVPSETIRQLARGIQRARGAAPVMYTGLEYSGSGVQAIRATMVLWALAGQLDVPGGRIFQMKANAFPINKGELIANPDIKKAIGRDRFPVYSQYRGESHAIALPESILEGHPYPIKTLIILGGSIITAWPQPDTWRQTLEDLDFLVTIDRQLTADAAYADIVLPATTGYENTSYMVYGPMFCIREQLIKPVGQARNDFFILAELARRLGYGHLYPQTEDELLEHALSGSGFSLREVRDAGGLAQIPTVMTQYRKWEKGLLRPDGRPGFATPSGKFEIASSILAEHGYDAIPVYTEPKESPLSKTSLSQEYPLVFNSGARVKTDFRSQHHGIESLARQAPEPEVTINTIDAGERGITDNAEVFVKTPRGQARFRARVTDDIMQGAIDANMGGGSPVGPKRWQTCNVNDLTDLSQYDPISGFPVYKALLCDVEPVAADIAATVDKAFIKDVATDLNTVSCDDETASPVSLIGPPVVYLDHNATTQPDPEVLEAMMPFLREKYGNPSSIHSAGVNAREAVDSSRRGLAQVINATARRIIFTSGGSEANNLAIKGIALAYKEKGQHIITSAVEHPSLMAACRALESQGFSITYLPVDKTGLVSPDTLEKAFRTDTILCSIMTANNETGSIQPIARLAALAKERDVLFHSDGVQALGKIPIDINELGVDLFSISSHKIHGPKGVGALFVREGISLTPLISGGDQEDSRRAGTENVAAIIGFAKAAEISARRLPRVKKIAKLRDDLEAGIMKLIEGARLNGHQTKRLPNTLNLTLPGFRGESLVMRLDRLGIALSSGSACKSSSPDPSHALLALGLTTEEAHCSVRFSLGFGNKESDINFVLEALAQVINESKNAIKFIPCR